MPPSLLEQLPALVEDGGPWRISFSDLARLARRVPDLALPEEWKIHRCEFCVFAKAGASRRGCLNNKHAVHRVLIRRGAGFVGQCHLGLTDMGEPLENDLPRRGGLPWISAMEFPVMLRRAMEFVLHHYAEPIMLAGVAGSLKVNADHPGRLIRQQKKGTLADFPGRVRVNHAYRMLESARYPVGGIALRVGYADAAHFGKVFKRLMPCNAGRVCLACRRVTPGRIQTKDQSSGDMETRLLGGKIIVL